MNFFPKDQYKPVLILLYVVVAASIWKFFSIYFSIPLTDDFVASFWLGTHKLFGALFLFGIVPMGIVKFVFRERLADYGLRIGITFRTIRSFLVALPFIVLIAVLTGHRAAFFDIYPLNEAIRPQNARIGYDIFAIHAVIYVGYYFGWEFLFRGFMQHGLSERCGVPVAILVQTLASTMLHYGHPATEVFGSIIAGLAWGYLTFRTQSILSCFGQHTLLGIVLDATLIFTPR